MRNADMADYSITAASVRAGTAATVRAGTAGATITAGQPVYIDSAASNQIKPARANADTTSRAVGIALNGAASGQPVDYISKDDDFTVGAASMAIGDILIVSAGAAGGIAPASDATTGTYVTILGVAKSTTKAKIQVGDAQQSRAAKV